MTCELLDLACLRVDDVGSVLDMVVNELFIGDVDQRSEVNDGNRDKRKAPERNEPNQPIRDQSRQESLR